VIALALVLAPVYMQAANALVAIAIAIAIATAGFAAELREFQLQEIAVKLVVILSLVQ
jgi:hypothetical protein